MYNGCISEPPDQVTNLGVSGWKVACKPIIVKQTNIRPGFTADTVERVVEFLGLIGKKAEITARCNVTSLPCHKEGNLKALLTNICSRLITVENEQVT